MILNEKEKAIAQTLCASEDTLAFLTRLFCPERSRVRQELEKNIGSLSDARYGQVMKVLYTSEQHFNNQMGELRRLGKPVSGKPPSGAKR